jgi:hypothetical protein
MPKTFSPQRRASTTKLLPAKPLSNADLKRIRSRVFPAAAPTPDIVVGFSSSAAQKFLAAHYKENPSFYDRSREKNPTNPIFDYTLDDHGTPRRVRFWAKVVQDTGQPAVALRFMQNNPQQPRLEAWWRGAYGQGSSAAAGVPQNVSITIPHAVLQINFPKLDGSGGENQLDLDYRIDVEAYMKLVSSSGQYALQLVNWDIALTQLSDPLDPSSAIWGNVAPPAPCLAEVKRLRQIIGDMVTIGANVALTQLTKTLTVSLPLPPLDIVKGVAVVPQNLTVTDNAVALGLLLQPSAIQQTVRENLESQLAQFQADLDGTDLSALLNAAPDDKGGFEKYLIAHVPAYAKLDAQLKSRLQPPQHRTRGRAAAALPTSDIFVMLDGGVFDAVAKSLLKANEGKCTDWITVDVLLGYARGRACYWLEVDNARGSLSGTTVSMGADVNAGGKLDLQLCVRIPCHPDECGTWSPGIGLDGPCDLNVSADTTSWNGNRALKLSARFSSVPGFVVYGLPPGVSDVANKLLSLLSSVILKAFLNAILSAVNIYLIQFPVVIGDTKVTATLSNLSASNQAGMLVLTSSAAFS